MSFLEKLIKFSQVTNKTFLVSQYGNFSYKQVLDTLRQLQDQCARLESNQSKKQQDRFFVIDGDGELAHIIIILYCILTNIPFIPQNRTLARNPKLIDSLKESFFFHCRGSKIESKGFGLDFQITKAPNSKTSLSNDDLGISGTQHESLACCFPTSGTTGTPKLIAVSNSQLYRGAKFVAEALKLLEEDRIAGLLSLDFDYGLNQLLVSLYLGSTYISCNLANEQSAFSQILYTERPSVIPLMPFLIERYFAGYDGEVESARLVTSSGGAITQKHRDIVRRVFSSASLIPMYGLSEGFRATISNVHLDALSPESVGLPIGDTTITIRDDDGQIVTQGDEGEVWQSGGCLTWGYWNDPEATNQRFIPDQHMPNRKWLKTGDIGFVNEHGGLVIVGRKAFQIKKYGIRISIDEIESALTAVLGNLSFVAIPVARTTTESDYDLAYESEADLDAQLLKKIRQSLPVEMWPRLLKRLSRIPLNVYGGKPDRFAISIMIEDENRQSRDR
jgi:acyl-coenzyme A synthetase/AMP-(fatty) acid ligase